MNKETFLGWQLGMVDALLIAEDEIVSREGNNNDYIFAEKQMANIIKCKISHKIREELKQVSPPFIHPTHIMITSHTGTYCKKCGCEGNLTKICDGDGQVNYEEFTVHPSHCVGSAKIGKWCKLCGLRGERELSERCACSYGNQ